MLSEGFWVFLVGTSAGIVGIVLKLCYDSKCSDIECCCIKIKRDIGKELEEDKFKIEHNIPQVELKSFRKERFDDAV
jgi:hypothetical protein